MRSTALTVGWDEMVASLPSVEATCPDRRGVGRRTTLGLRLAAGDPADQAGLVVVHVPAAAQHDPALVPDHDLVGKQTVCPPSVKHGLETHHGEELVDGRTLG